ncbi:ATP-binding cassette, subfamily B [Methylobacterium sp. 174MFSha1.1]|uniref:peptidase domain-containing ABC transporter n=1 Tax=Methylobacterium sp. 174MFSha1.1 TaxID=1502749 RepID=UPI0008F1D13D|nr:peptidase domain-containing ABC transporter [Methylobacterium sp. 174MFSha1.1]SFU46641.1 ATP-binding cassette, subfamily B [Methylobacterium sp. 174MFSha1.1]
MSQLQAGSTVSPDAEVDWPALQCLALVARQHGVHLTPEQLIHDNQLQAGSVTPAVLLRCAKQAGLTGKLLKLKWRHVPKLHRALPAIVFLSDGSALLLTAVQASDEVEQVVLQDPLAPEDAPLVLDRMRFEELWDGRTLIIKRDYSLRDEEQPFGLKFIATLIFRERRILRDVVIAAVFLSLLTLVPILFFRLMTDRVLSHSAMSTFVVLCIALAICIIFETIFSALRRALLLHLTARIDVKMTMLIFERIVRLPVEVFEKTPVGLIARNMNEAHKVKQFLTNQLFGTILDSICLVFFLPVMFVLSPMLTSIVLGCCLIIAAWIAAMLPVYAKRTNAVIAAEGQRGSFLVQTLQGIRTVKSLALEPRQIHQYDVLVARISQLRIAEGHMANVIQSAIIPMERFMLTGTLAIGVYLALSSKDSSAVAQIFIFLLLSQRIVGPLRQMAQLLEQYEEAKSSVNLVSGLVNAGSEDERQGRGVRQPLTGHIEFASVRFQYSGANSPALDAVSFELPPGTTLGIMGRSGSGKTTVTRLLQRLHTNYDGLIKIDGVDVREYALDHLRGSLGVVLQDNFLFSGTIRDNIIAAKPDASFDEVVRVARLAGAEEFIDRLPRGYETYINEGSNNLSGGQRQRIAIARALITNPRILILDEATSALDPESEAIVNANLRRISEGRTVIVISHRLSSLVSSDAILVLERGRIHDIGKHAELLTRCDIYRDLWNQQNAPVRDGADAKLRLVS